MFVFPSTRSPDITSQIFGELGRIGRVTLLPFFRLADFNGLCSGSLGSTEFSFKSAMIQLLKF